MIQNHKVDTNVRPVIVHYHIFKNAGTTIDGILEKNFGQRLAYLHGERADSTVTNTDLLQFLHTNPKIMAVSSHHLRLPKPQSESFFFFEIIFLRHPLDRLRSTYDFYRRAEIITDPLGVQARQLDLGHFAELLLTRYPHLVNDAQVNCLANAGRYAQAPSDQDLEKAVRVATQAAVPGVTELFDLSMSAAKYCLYPVFGYLDLRYVKQNVSSSRLESLEARLHHMKQACGPSLYDKLLELNTLDLQLIEHTSKEIQRRLRYTPNSGAKMSYKRARDGRDCTFFTRVLSFLRHRVEGDPMEGSD